MTLEAGFKARALHVEKTLSGSAAGCAPAPGAGSAGSARG